MFTGIIEEIGKVTALEKLSDGIRLTIEANIVTQDLKVDDSISIDGVCQTVVRCNQNGFTVEAVGETLEKSTLGSFIKNRQVNLERSLTLETRLGGHLVQGHVNGVGRISQWQRRGENYFLEIEVPPELTKYLIPEGSISIDGISLTIAKLFESHVGFNIIPHTVQHTTLKSKKEREFVNIEVDMIARYVERFLNQNDNSKLTIDKLKNWGY